MLALNFLSKRVLEYQKKKLTEAENNLQYHISKKEQLKGIHSTDNQTMENEEKLIKIWIRNVEKLKKEIEKLNKNT